MGLFLDILNGVSVGGLNADGRKTHGDHSWGDVGDVQIKLAILKTASFSAHHLPKKVHFN